MIWLLSIAAAALCFMLPGMADPYQAPRVLLLALLAVPLVVRKSSYGSLLGLPLFLGLLAWSVAAFFSHDRSATLVGAYLSPFDAFPAVFSSVAIAIGVARIGASVEDAAVAICWASLPLSAYAWIQRAILHFDPLLPAPIPGTTRVLAMQGSPLFLGAALVIVIACAAWLMQGDRARNLGTVALSMALPALWFTGTRGAFIGAAAAAFVLLRGRYRIAAVCAALTVFIIHRETSMNSDLGRIAVWRESWAIFRAHPWVGTGPGTFGMVSRAYITPAYIAAQGSALYASQHAHNQLLQVLATSGLVGLVGYLAVVAGVLRLAWTAPGRDRAVLLAVLAGYAVVAALNPCAQSVLVLLALLFGCASSQFAYNEYRALGWVPVLAACLFVAGRAVVADGHYARALHSHDRFDAADQFNQAAQINPWEIKLAVEQLNSAISLAGMLPTPGSRAELARGCVAIARENLARHPHDSFAHEILGRAVLVAVFLGHVGSPAEALEQYEIAQALAPTFPFLMHRRLAMARAMGDTARARRAEQDLARVQSWEKGGA